MKIYFSKTQNAADVSGSCWGSMDMWGHDGNDILIHQDENLIIYEDSSYDDWNHRNGLIVNSKNDNTSFTMHFTGMGFGWGEIKGEIKGNLLIIPTGLDIDGRSVYDAVKNNPEWCEFSHPLFYVFGDGFQYQKMPI